MAIKASPSALRIGVAAIDLTPPIGVGLSGYRPRNSDGVGHRLRAEALVCRGAGGAWALVTSDVIGYGRDYVKIIRQKIARLTGLRPEAIMISGTHTHSGPAVIRFGDEEVSPLDAAYNQKLQGLLVRVAAAAFKAARPGRFEIAWTEAPALGSNRRVRRNNGEWTNEWEDDFGRHPGYFDPTVMLVGVRRPGQAGLDALLVNYGVHPVVLGPGSLKISADYVGYLKDSLEALGLARTTLFALAGGGNINPRTCIKVGAEFPRKMGEALADLVAHAAARLSPVAGTRVASHREPWTVTRTRQPAKPSSTRGRKVGDDIPTEIQVLRAGDLVFLSTPGELFSEFSRMFREASPFPHTAVVSLANDYIGYLPTDAAQAEGAYETNMAPAAGLQGPIMEHARKAFAAVAD
jgi:hypothetical protein